MSICPWYKAKAKFYIIIVCTSWFRYLKLEQIELCHFYTLIFSFLSEKKIFKSSAYNLGTEKERSFHSSFHLCKRSFSSFIQHCRWRKTKVAYYSASSEGHNVKVGNAGSPLNFKYSFFCTDGRVSTNAPLFSGRLPCDSSGEDGRRGNRAAGGGYFFSKVKSWWLLPAIITVCGVMHLQGLFVSFACCDFRFLRFLITFLF